jgi:hypothetical protein
VVLVTTAVVLAVSGGFRTTVGGFRISVRSPLATSFAALITGAWWLYLARRERSVAADLEASWFAIERNASRLVGAVALTAVIVSSTFATRSASGADASGYLTQAAIWHQHRFFLRDELSLFLAGRVIDWPSEDFWLTTPLGWRPVGVPAMQAPTYPPGLPLLMALPQALGGIGGANAVIIASAGLAVWATGMLVGGINGVLAALLLAFSPAFLYQSIQPMSDVPVTAAWMICFLMVTRTRLSFDAGIVCALAALIRPNLAPLAIIPLLIAKSKFTFAMPVAIAGAFLMFMQRLWYGSPFLSGYGPADELFAFSNIGPNVIRYFNWLLATAPVLLLAPLGFARVRANSQSRALAGFALLVIAAYLIYGVFDHWSYLRFLLPALAVFAIFASVELMAWIDRWPRAWRAPIFLGLTLLVMAHGLFVARALDTFKLADQLRRVEQVAGYVVQNTPQNAVVVAGEQSGSMRYYTGRSILRWEAATPEKLTAAVGLLEQSGRPVYVVLDAWENELFLAKFKQVPEVGLDWPPVVDAGMSHRTRLWRVGDRARFLAGENLRTIRLP